MYVFLVRTEVDGKRSKTITETEDEISIKHSTEIETVDRHYVAESLQHLLASPQFQRLLAEEEVTVIAQTQTVQVLS